MPCFQKSSRKAASSSCGGVAKALFPDRADVSDPHSLSSHPVCPPRPRLYHWYSNGSTSSKKNGKKCLRSREDIVESKRPAAPFDRTFLPAASLILPQSELGIASSFFLQQRSRMRRRRSRMGNKGSFCERLKKENLFACPFVDLGTAESKLSIDENSDVVVLLKTK